MADLLGNRLYSVSLSSTTQTVLYKAPSTASALGFFIANNDGALTGSIVVTLYRAAVAAEYTVHAAATPAVGATRYDSFLNGLPMALNDELRVTLSTAMGPVVFNTIILEAPARGV